MRTNIFLFLFICLATGCKDYEKTVYNLDIPREQMVPLLVDLSIAESSIERNMSTKKDSLRIAYRSKITAIYNLTSDRIDSNLNLLSLNPNLNSELQKEVLDSLKSIDKQSKVVKYQRAR